MDMPQAPVAQEVRPEVGGVAQTPQQPSVDPQTPSEPVPPEKPKKSKTKKIAIGLILSLVLMMVAYGIFLTITYLNCTKTAPKACETNKCSFSLSGFKSTTETKEDCCGNTKCEVGEISAGCSIDCPSCDDDSECTKDSYDYGGQECVYEQLFAPCYVRIITLNSTIPEDDYQIKVELSSTNFDYSKAETNGEDIRFFDEDDNPLSFWIEEWNSEGVSIIWIKVANSEVDEVYMSYGYPDASSASAGSSVFEFFEGFDYSSESELTKVWNNHGSPTIELSMVVGSAGNTFTFNPASGPSYLGDAQPTKNVILSPEFPGATLVADGGTNTGSMSSDFCSYGNTNPADINTTVCTTTNDIHNYYTWTTTEVSAQDYDLWIRYRMPADFSTFSASDTIKAHGWRTDTTNNAINVSLYDDQDAQCGTTTNVGTGTTAWTQTALTGDETGCTNISAGDIVTFLIKLVADQDDSVRIGEITFDYEAQF